MSKRPVIGITPSMEGGVVKMNQDYLAAVLDAGGIPVFLPYTNDPAKLAAYVALSDGLLFSGGGDVHPARYGETKKPECGEPNEARDAFELALFGAFFPTGKPIFGICRGEQLLNVALGGTLIQHLDAHRQTAARDVATHPVAVEGGSRILSAVGARSLSVNSFHHQAVAALAPTLVVSARAEDGVIEAVESEGDRFLLGVQWHPEALYRRDPAAAALFAAFIAACDQNA